MSSLLFKFISYVCLSTVYTNAFSIENSSSRRDMLVKSASTFAGAISFSSGWISPDSALADDDTQQQLQYTTYQIFPDASSKLDPKIKQVQPSKLNQLLANTKGGTIWLGEHHNSAQDHLLQAQFVRSIHEQRQKNKNSGKMSVGLEMIQLQFQPVLDAYISKQISAKEMYEQVQWEKRWNWSFENYLPIFETCRELDIPLIALNVNTEDLNKVEEGGLPNLPRDRMQQYISDPNGFALFASSPYYKTYVDYVISPSYDMHKSMGIIGDMSFTNFFSGRILWDESMASNAYKWTKSNDGGLMIGLVGADHVKFQGGITGRYQRMAQDQNLSCNSVILNPTLIDTRPSGSVSMESNSLSAASTLGDNGLSLQLRYIKKGIQAGTPESRESRNTGGVLPLADYVVLSKA